MKTVSYATIAVNDAIKTSIATSASPATYTGVQLNGVIGTAAMNPPRTISVTTSTHTGSYNLAGIVINGKNASGQTVSATLTLTQANGNEVLVTTQEFSAITSIVVPAMVDALGTFKFGVRDIVCDALSGPAMLRIGTSSSGSLKVQYPDGSVDTFKNCTAGEQLEITPTIIYGDSGTTISDLSLFYRTR